MLHSCELVRVGEKSDVPEHAAIGRPEIDLALPDKISDSVKSALK
jgi:hypothetical protein